VKCEPNRPEHLYSEGGDGVRRLRWQRVFNNQNTADRPSKVFVNEGEKEGRSLVSRPSYAFLVLLCVDYLFDGPAVVNVQE
jgi:hypothetical protein